MTESEIQKQIIDYCNAAGALVFRMNAGGRGHNIKKPPKGTPDVLVIFNRVALWIEVKTKKGIISDDQKKMHMRLTGLGQHIIVARSLDDVIDKLKILN